MLTPHERRHAQQIIAIFAAMRELARQLRAAGHFVCDPAIDGPDNRQELPDSPESSVDDACHGRGYSFWWPRTSSPCLMTKLIEAALEALPSFSMAPRPAALREPEPCPGDAVMASTRCAATGDNCSPS